MTSKLERLRLLPPRLKKWLWGSCSILLLVLIVVAASNIFILSSTSDRIVHESALLSATKYGLVLGTTPRFRRTGNRNPTFVSRMVSAAKLYNDGKVEKLLLSGGNQILGYNEVESMKEMLLAMGIPPEALILDGSGVRTFDSVWRTRNLFQQNKFIVITDDKHLPRALFLCKAMGVDAMGYSLNKTPLPFSFKYFVRESGARVKALLDIYILSTKPMDTNPPPGLPSPV